MKTNKSSPRRRGLRGGVLILFGLTLVVLLGFAGLVIDLGRFFVIRSELQNAADACALAAASQLRPEQNDANALTRAVAYGRVFTTGGVPTETLPGFPLAAIQNKAKFQSATVDIQSSHISFSATLDGTYQTAGAANPNTARYAKCDYPLTGLPIYFMKVLNLLGASFDTQTVSAMATATRGSMACNLIAVGICQYDSSATHGLTVGAWIEIDKTSDKNDTTPGAPGYFGWMDHSPKAGGTKELVGELTAVGQCAHIEEIHGNKLEPGAKSRAKKGWNTRFGIIERNFPYSFVTAPPDLTGHAYFDKEVLDNKGNVVVEKNWDWSPSNLAFGDYQAAQGAFRAYDSTLDIFGNQAPTVAAANDLRQYGRKDRRFVITPVVDCPSRDVTALGCSLMLNPFGKVGGTDVDGKLEYQGLVGDPGSPCGSDITLPTMSVLVK